MNHSTRTLGWSLAAALAIAISAVCVPDVRAAMFLLAFWLTYALVFGSPFILACLLIWYFVRRVDRGTRRRGFEIMPPRGRDTPHRSGDGRTSWKFS
jgi:hypothetical protein